MPGLVWLLAPLIGQGQQIPPLPQNPSPMQEHLRRHQRIEMDTGRGISIPMEGFAGARIMIYLPRHFRVRRKADLLVHFHGGFLPVAYAAEKYKGNLIGVSVQLGTGSGVYSRAFATDSIFAALESRLWQMVAERLGRRPVKGRLLFSGFSAGYGAVRSLLRQPGIFQRVDGVLLLDGLHASYMPENRLLAAGGKIDSMAMQPFVDYARASVWGNKHFLFTHSAIFPGTFVSTTEAADYLLQKLNIRARPVLEWGPGGMQQLSRASAGHFQILGFAGNTAPDHVDHFHGLYYFLNHL
ncbi:hypothetical protein [Niabella terrae]